MIQRLILFTKGIETLWYFSLRLGKAFEKLGYEVFYFDQCKEYDSFVKLLDFAKPHITAAVSFNFDGCSGEEYMYDKYGIHFFDSRDIPQINIVVDHPLYYHKFIPYLPKDYIQISIDLEHDEYLERFFPDIKRGPFLPLAGTALYKKDDLKGYDERTTDIVFTGNYNPIENYDSLIHRNGEEYAGFYMDLLDDLISNPQKELSSAIEEHIKRDIEDADTDEKIRDVMPYMNFIDLYIRSYYRGEVIRTLADAGLKVHCYGSGWDILRKKSRHPELIISGSVLDSRECLEKINDARISVNVMPWFKRGAHDRVFNSMLGGAVCVTDESEYLLQDLDDEEDVIFYNLKDMSALPDKVTSVLNDKDKWTHITSTAYDTAIARHMWEHRARRIHDEVLLRM